ncbi:MAG: NOP5/NOP56 family protein [Candidatus Nanohaloarchaea archaeon]
MNDIRDRAIERTRESLKQAADRDRLMMKAVDMLDQVNNDLNAEMERLRDWYAIHFPELEDEIGDSEDFVNILSRGVRRDELDAFSSMAEDSTGAELLEEDYRILEKTVETVEKKFEYREDLEEYIQSVAEEETPNLSALLGPLLTARLLSLAGGLEDMAKKPSSTVQMLGAEKALFRYLRGEGTPPKHGILFQHEFISSLPDSERGKMARFLANKAVIAARLDAYGDKEKGGELREECRDKYEELKD